MLHHVTDVSNDDDTIMIATVRDEIRGWETATFL